VPVIRDLAKLNKDTQAVTAGLRRRAAPAKYPVTVLQTTDGDVRTADWRFTHSRITIEIRDFPLGHDHGAHVNLTFVRRSVGIADEAVGAILMTQEP
jgi:hypothetical protein